MIITVNNCKNNCNPSQENISKFITATTEKEVEVLVKELEKKMKEAREKIKEELMKGQKAYGENLKQVHQFYVSFIHVELNIYISINKHPHTVKPRKTL